MSGGKRISVIPPHPQGLTAVSPHPFPLGDAGGIPRPPLDEDSLVPSLGTFYPQPRVPITTKNGPLLGPAWAPRCLSRYTDQVVALLET